VSTPSDSPNQSGRVSRGTLLKRTGAIALGTSLFSMGDPLTVLAVQTKRTALKPDGDLAYFNWAQYINPKLLRGFEKEYGVKVKESNFTNMETMLAKIRAGVKYDVAFPEAQTAAQLVQAKLLAPLDHAKLTNWGQVNEAFHNPWYDAGAKFTVPYAIWTTGIAYRTDKVKGMTKSWNDLWNHPEAAKHTYLLDDFREVIGMGLLKTGTDDVNSKSSSAVGKAQSEILKLKPRLRGFTSLNTEMANGTSWLTHMWSGTVYQALLASKHPELLHYQVNKEGIPVGSDTMVAFKNAPHPNTATLFIDYMLRAEVAAKNSNFISFANSNAASWPMVDAAVKNNPGIFPTPEAMKKLVPDLPETAEFTRQLTRTWTRFRTGK